MSKFALSKLESKIMEGLWKEDTPLSIKDMKEIFADSSELSIRQIVTRLEKRGILKITGFRKDKGIVQLYYPTISQADYLRDSLSQKCLLSLTSSFISDSDDVDALEDLAKLLDEKIKALKARKK